MAKPPNLSSLVSAAKMKALQQAAMKHGQKAIAKKKVK